MLLQHIVLIESLAKILRSSIIETEFYQIQSINLFGDALQAANKNLTHHLYKLIQGIPKHPNKNKDVR